MLCTRDKIAKPPKRAVRPIIVCCSFCFLQNQAACQDYHLQGKNLDVRCNS